MFIIKLAFISFICCISIFSASCFPSCGNTIKQPKGDEDGLSDDERLFTGEKEPCMPDLIPTAKQRSNLSFIKPKFTEKGKKQPNPVVNDGKKSQSDPDSKKYEDKTSFDSESSAYGGHQVGCTPTCFTKTESI